MENTTITTQSFDLIPEILERHSPRAFKDQPVPKAALKAAFEAARWSASAFNEQPWRFVVGMKGEGNTYDQIFDSLVEGNQTWAVNAPVLILAVAKDRYSQMDRPNSHAWYDTGQAVGALALQVTKMGLYMHQMAGFSSEKARENLGIAEGFSPVAVIALGYKGDPDMLPEGLKERELAPRVRKEPEQFVFSGEWGKAWK